MTTYFLMHYNKPIAQRNMTMPEFINARKCMPRQAGYSWEWPPVYYAYMFLNTLMCLMLVLAAALLIYIGCWASAAACVAITLISLPRLSQYCRMHEYVYAMLVFILLACVFSGLPVAVFTLTI